MPVNGQTERGETREKQPRGGVNRGYNEDDDVSSPSTPKRRYGSGSGTDDIEMQFQPQNRNNGERRPKRSYENNRCVRCVVTIAVILCVAEIISYLASIVMSILCLWGVSPKLAGKDVPNSTSTNYTCDPYKAQESIPYSLIDFMLAFEPAVIILFWKHSAITEALEEYESENPHGENDLLYRIRRTAYFATIVACLSFLLNCVECATCSFSNQVVLFGTLWVGPVSKAACPWLSLVFHFALFPYCVYCWYATRVACVLRRRADYIKKYIDGDTGSPSSCIFVQYRHRPDIILKMLNRKIFHDDWHNRVWKHLSFLMNLMMFFSATLVLLYTHVYISEVRQTILEWSTHFTRLITIAALSITPYLHVAFACVRVTEAYEHISASMDKAQVPDESEGSNPALPSNTSASVGASAQNSTREERPLDPLEYLHHRQLLESNVNKMCHVALRAGVLGSSYTTRSGVHLAMLGVIFAMTWEVLDRFNDFDVERANALAYGPGVQEGVIVTLFGTIALVLFTVTAIVVLCWEKCCCFKQAGHIRSDNCFRKENFSSTMKVVFSVVSGGVFIVAVYLYFYFLAYKDEFCYDTSNKLFE